jgi:hypothetical protein
LNRISNLKTQTTTTTTTTTASSMSSSVDLDNPTELPDSLTDAAERAANSCYEYSKYEPLEARCRVDFDTSAGDETFPLIKTSTEFMQNFVSCLAYRYVPGLQEEKQKQLQRVAEARVALQQILQQEQTTDDDDDDSGSDSEETTTVAGIDIEEKRKYMSILQNNGKIVDDSSDTKTEYDGPIVRVYFPDEGNAALAKRDWTSANGVDMPDCVKFNGCGGVVSKTQDVSKDCLIFFFCPKASESEQVEEILYRTELQHSQSNSTQQLLTVFVNPILVDMGVTGFGMAGRMLRERLIDKLMGVYYLRTLQWGALTRKWPNSYTLWEEDTEEDGGYKLIRTLPYLPSNPEVEDIYDEVNSGKIQIDENGNIINKKGPSALDKFGDFVNGMMRL